MRLLIILWTLVTLTGYSGWKQLLAGEGNEYDLINNAILDFSNTERLFKQDSTFYVMFIDTMYSMKLERVDDRTLKWIPDKKYEDIIGVSIMGSIGKIYYIEANEIGSLGNLPSRYIEKNNKLYYWYDDDYPLTQDAVDVLKKYNVIEKIESIAMAEFIIDDGKKGASYYFCRDDFSKYKKVVSAVAIGYDIPKLHCPE
ncbi:MAG: hypothetical protein ABFS32_16985 [Bacteroidota bacterium]